MAKPRERRDRVDIQLGPFSARVIKPSCPFRGRSSRRARARVSRRPSRPRDPLGEASLATPFGTHTNDRQRRRRRARDYHRQRRRGRKGGGGREDSDLYRSGAPLSPRCLATLRSTPFDPRSPSPTEATHPLPRECSEIAPLSLPPPLGPSPSAESSSPFLVRRLSLVPAMERSIPEAFSLGGSAQRREGCVCIEIA